MSTEVKKKSDKRLIQGESTRTALLDAARLLFGANGYAATSLDEIVTQAGVTKGALYHHFSDKESLFRAVVEQVELEVSDQVVVEFLRPDSWEAVILGCHLWISAHLDPAVRQIILGDGRGVLGWETMRAIDNRFSAVALRGALRKAMHAGVISQQPLRPLAQMLTGALTEACLYVAEADDQAAALDEVTGLITTLLTGMQRPPAAVATGGPSLSTKSSTGAVAEVSSRSRRRV